jgi:hypothetical protein
VAVGATVCGAGLKAPTTAPMTIALTAMTTIRVMTEITLACI